MKRIITLATFVALVLVSLTAIAVRADESSTVVVRAQSSAYHLNFVTAASKRSDLRLKIAAQGPDAAFTEWLRVAHPSDYRAAVAHTLATGSREAVAVRAATSYCCAKDGNCCNGNCSVCCAKGQCTMGCCKMDACKKMKLSCCK